MSNYFSRGDSFRSRRAPEEVDPMSSLSNIGDVMLVFACGLMVALRDRVRVPAERDARVGMP